MDAAFLSETLFCFFENLHRGKYRGGNSYAEYFCYALGILKVIIIKEIKKKQLDRTRLHPESPDGLEEKLVLAEGSSGEEALLHNETEDRNRLLSARARELFGHLTPQMQQMIYFHVVENWSYARLSQHFGVPKQTLVSRFNSAMDKMRKRMKFPHTNTPIEYFHYRSGRDERS